LQFDFNSVLAHVGGWYGVVGVIDSRQFKAFGLSPPIGTWWQVMQTKAEGWPSTSQ